MEFLRKNFSTSISLKQVFLFSLLGITLSLTINSIFIFTNFINPLFISSGVDDLIIYIIAYIIRIFTSCIIGPFIEEILFRGILFNFLSKRINIILSALITTVIFSLIHFNIPLCVFALVTGFFFVYFYIKTNNLFIPIIMHSFCNLMSLFILFVPISLFTIILYITLTIVIFIFCKNVMK